MMHARAGLIAVLTTVLLMLCGATSASACNEPSLALGKTTAGPGENVPFSIASAGEGAQFSLTVAGRQVASGTAGPGFSSGFNMPDLGSSQTVYAELVVSHEGSEWFSSKPMSFEAPAPVSQPQSQTPAQTDSPAAPPVATPAPAPTGRAPRPQAPAASGPGHAPRIAPEPSVSEPVGQGTRGNGSAKRGAGAETAQAPAEALVSSPTAAEASAAAESQQAAHAGAAGRGRGARVQAPAPVRRSVPVHAWGTTPTGTDGGLTPSVALAVWLLVLAGLAGGGFGFARVRSRRPAPWVPPAVAAEVRVRDLLIEAELQEIVAEARASEALGAPEPEAEPAEAVAQTASESRDLVGAPGG